MPPLDVNPLVLKDVLLDIDGTDYRKHVDQVSFTPSSSSLTWTGLGGNTHTDVATATWVANLNYVQDWETPNSLSRFLFENEGEEVPVTFRPRNGSGPSFTTTLVITPGAIGGAVNAFATTSVALGCKEKPALVAAP